MYRLFPQKGAIRVGADADLVLFDPQATTTVDSNKWHSKAAPTDRLYTGMELHGELRQTLLGGKVIYRDGKLLGNRGDGRFVRPQ